MKESVSRSKSLKTRVKWQVQMRVWNAPITFLRELEDSPNFNTERRNHGNQLWQERTAYILQSAHFSRPLFVGKSSRSSGIIYLHNVGDIAGPVLPVLEVDVGLGGSLDRDGEWAGSRLPRPHVKLRWFALHPALQAGSAYRRERAESASCR